MQRVSVLVCVCVCVQVLESVSGLVVKLQESAEPSAGSKEKGDAVACQILLLSLLMEVTCY